MKRRGLLLRSAIGLGALWPGVSGAGCAGADAPSNEHAASGVGGGSAVATSTSTSSSSATSTSSGPVGECEPVESSSTRCPHVAITSMRALATSRA
jgi:hypothetical protein